MAKDTKQRLAESLKALLSSKPLDRITVKEIVENCGINRQTFYYNFRDVYALLDWIFQQETAALRINDPSCPWQEGFTRTVRYFRDNRSMILNAYHSIGRTQLEQYLTDALTPVLRNQIKMEAAELSVSEQDLEIVVSLHTAGFLGIIFAWLDNSMNDSFPISLERFVTLISASVRSMLEKISELPPESAAVQTES